MSEYTDDLVKSTFVPNRPSVGVVSPEEKLPFEDEAISLMVKLGVTNWGRASLAIASVYLGNAFNDGWVAGLNHPAPSKAKQAEETI
jgi:hypothetical protein